ncbi:hypothetical protein [Flavobacterium sp. N1719]|uniref:hypothetical protein n=1 Tax=Flavobacterium sp. N1719 TaxID=2885633 RepID=UPI00222222EC|nr:hypothetical protein [Flavobacterium sp. N1719]
MHAFQCKIVEQKKPSALNLTRSELLLYYGFFVLLVQCAIGYFLFEKKNIETPILFTAFTILTVLAILFSSFLRLTEHQNFNAEYIGDFRIEDNHFHCAGREFSFASIQNLKTDISDFYGKETGNRRIGPRYSNGISNFIHFDSAGKSFTFQLEILKEQAIYDFEWALINCICSERIPYQYSNFDCIAETNLDMPTVRNFIFKLVHEQRLDASDRLVIRGFSNEV